ncbi:gamma-glutamyltransferase [Sphingomonas sp. Root710]|uniref:gamma-glutamyltransferase family protein n=1 Tax=Sphingomonas sp. Root710 TaxID=1736594 RepID=UPI0007007D85|nr:gamma-glutamyltransferase family protein [Sphingomonas sp. Root710]KRB85558.1 gamma-glutamyltransferase [Sphingomonas sp. Root710]
MTDETFTARPNLSGTMGAVASTHWLASAVGMRLLEAGGNAFDAAVAAGFTLQVVEPHLNGPGGDSTIIVSRASDARPSVICGQGPAPLAATIAHFEALGLDSIPGTGLLAACTPGAFGAWLVMLRDFGTQTLRSVLSPAIEYALEGHPLLGQAAGVIASVADLFRDEWTTSAEVFLPGGAVPLATRLFRNRPLGDFYLRLLEHAESVSPDRERQIEAALSYWYEGPVAEAIDRFCRDTAALDVSGRKHHGLLTAADLNGWRPPIEAPLSTHYRGYEIFKCGVWSQGPTMLMALQILETFDLSTLDRNGARFVHLVIEAIKLAMADRDAWLGDAADVPIAALLDPSYARERAGLIGDRASMDLQPGRPNGLTPVVPFSGERRGAATYVPGGGEPTFRRDTAIRDTQRGDTCHVDVVDRWGNAVAATPSGGWLQSSPLIPELGFALGTRLQMAALEPGHANSLMPGKRPRTSLTPTLISRDGKPYMALGSPGGDQQEQWSLQLVLNHIDFGMAIQQGIEAPAFHTDHLVGSFWPRTTALGAMTVEGRFPEGTIAELREMGHEVTVGGPWSEGRLSACSYELEDGTPVIRAGANPRGMQGYAIAR